MFCEGCSGGGCLSGVCRRGGLRRRLPPGQPGGRGRGTGQPEFAKGVRILDVRPRADYAARHVAGAVWVDLAAWDKASRDGKDVSFWEKQIGALGIDLNTPVVIYDNGSGVDAATIWWILRYWGVKDVRLLNAGWPGWLFARKLTDRAEPQIEARAIKLQPQHARRAVKARCWKSCESGGEQLIDVRSDREFSGSRARPARNGAIPSARHLDWSDGLESYRNLWRIQVRGGSDPGIPQSRDRSRPGRSPSMARSGTGAP